MNDQILNLRNGYRACVKLAEETDSKKESAYLRAEAQNLLQELRQSCLHDFVVVLNSYEKSYSSYEYSTPEERICLICGIKERGWKQIDFKLLSSIPLSRFEFSAPPEVQHPLTALLEESKEIALEKGSKYFPW